MASPISIYKKALSKADHLRGTETTLEFKAYVEAIAEALKMEGNWNHLYSLSDLSRFAFMPVRNPRSIRKLVVDKKIKASVFGQRNNKRYFFKVRDIIQYLDNNLQTVSSCDTLKKR